MNSAIANSFLLNSPNNALGCYFLILLPKTDGFSLRSSIKLPFFTHFHPLSLFLEQTIALAQDRPLFPFTGE
jgi:hypothetical protein